MSDALFAAEHAVQQGHPREALKHLTEAVRAHPGNPKLRVFLVQLLCLLGEWNRAHTQLNVAADLDASVGPMREMTGHALRCELLRTGVFEGRRTPMVFGQPQQWLAMLIESLLHHAPAEAVLAQDLAARAFDAAPAVAGIIDGSDFSWIADGDARLGPVLEAMVDGRYYWVPFENLASIRFEAPVDLRDMVWLPAYLGFTNGGESVAMIPSRYPGSERDEDEAIVMGRRTDWVEVGPDRWLGRGQRVLMTDTGEHDLLGIRQIQFRHD